MNADGLGLGWSVSWMDVWVRKRGVLDALSGECCRVREFWQRDECTGGDPVHERLPDRHEAVKSSAEETERRQSTLLTCCVVISTGELLDCVVKVRFNEMGEILYFGIVIHFSKHFDETSVVPSLLNWAIKPHHLGKLWRCRFTDSEKILSGKISKRRILV